LLSQFCTNVDGHVLREAMMKIVVLDGYTLNPGDLSWNGLESLGKCEIYDRSSPAEVLKRAGGAEIVLVNKIVLSREAIFSLPHLKYIGVTATGRGPSPR
jgi:glycerate dehydrogenase